MKHKIKVKEVEQYEVEIVAETLEDAEQQVAMQYHDGTLEKPRFENVDYSTFVNSKPIL
jgi:hypothetical protein